MTIQATIDVYSFKLNFTLSAQGYPLPTAKILLPFRLEHSQYRRWPLSEVSVSPTIYKCISLSTPVSFPDLPFLSGGGLGMRLDQYQSHSQTSSRPPPGGKGGLGMRLDQYQSRSQTPSREERGV